jgi:hypothetical protein
MPLKTNKQQGTCKQRAMSVSVSENQKAKRTKQQQQSTKKQISQAYTTQLKSLRELVHDNFPG